MLPALDECDDGCTLSSVQARLNPASWLIVAISCLPFVLTFLFVCIVVYHRLFPTLSGPANAKDGSAFQSSFASSSPPSRSSTYKPKDGPSTLRRLSAVTFAITIALAAVLAELILCEIANSLDPVARTWSLQITLATLLILLVIVIPLLEIRSILTAAGWTFSDESSRRSRSAWTLQILAFAAWLVGFWLVGLSLPSGHVHAWKAQTSSSLREACLERVGVIGVCLMALLSGFASVSAPWQAFGARVRHVSEADIERKKTGIEATAEMLETKRGRLRALVRKLSDAPTEGFMSKFMGTIRGNADSQERNSLELEISGLETMHRSLTTSLAVLQERRRSQQQAQTSLGRVLMLVSYLFSTYCLYRILATLTASFRRWWRPDITFAGSDPINNLLALLAKHWDPSLDRLAWSRQISFFLSGVILLASFSSVMQTFLLLSRFTPGILQQAQANLALLVSQFSATYVISSALLLRSNVPPEVSSVISDALGAPLDSAFVDRWFEVWFLVASGLTAVGILLGRKLAGSGEWDDDRDDIELGDKRL